MTRIICLFTALILAVTFHPQRSAAQTTLLGYNTSGDVYQITPDTGALTLKAAEQIHSFSLGAIVRRKSSLYYVAAPSGATENSLFIADTKNGSISHVDLDLADADDEAVALFFDNRKLFGLFYNGNTGSLTLRVVNPTTGVTRIRRDLSTLNLEPVAGSLSRIGKKVYFLAKPASNSARRQLVEIKTNSPLVKVTEVQTKGGSPTPVLCDRIKLIRKSLKFLCLASPSATQVDVYNLNVAGRATFLSTLTGIERIAGGHTMVTPNEKVFYAFVYATGETNNQRLLKLSAKGEVKTNSVVSTLIVGARFGAEEPEIDEE